MTDLDEFVTRWGFCPHPEQLLEEHSHLCHECQNDPSQRSFTYEEMAELTHEKQVAIFGWCSCEWGDRSYDDCD